MTRQYYHKKSSDQRGFQLIEVMVAVVILGIAFGSLIMLSMGSSKQLQKSADLLMAISLSQLVMEKSKALPYGLIDSVAFTKVYKGSSGTSGLFDQFEALDGKSYSIDDKNTPALYKQLQSMNYQYKIEVEKIDNTADSKFIQVTIQWTNKGNILSYQLNGYLSKRV
ncbi:MAG: type II secretion system protein [Candidatus Cloacimonetes bacterium]|nr:type II secretion system protein [Candidatus Cloacimonadota bacterium]